MPDNQEIRRYLRRELDERMTHIRDFGCLLRLVGYQAFAERTRRSRCNVDQGSPTSRNT